MARYDVFRNPDRPGYLLDVQSQLIEALDTRVVVPLVPIDSIRLSVDRLHPKFTISSTDHMMMTHLLAAVPAHILRVKETTLSQYSDDITNALDMLFHGF